MTGFSGNERKPLLGNRSKCDGKRTSPRSVAVGMRQFPLGGSSALIALSSSISSHGPSGGTWLTIYASDNAI